MDKELKRKITERWKILAGSVTHLDAHEVTALAQLEYILSEAGLLSRKRARARRKVSQPMIPLSGSGDDNTMFLSEVEGIRPNE